MNQFFVGGLAIAAVLTGSELARAQEAEPAAPASTEASPAPAETSPPEAPPPPEPAAPAAIDTTKPVTDGTRFRFGISGGAGFFTATGERGGEASCTYFGADLRLGAQINDIIGVYAQPTLGYYSADLSGIVGAGGLLGAAVIADATLIDRLFVGAGIGYTVYNNPGGVTPILRFGGYPLMGHSKGAARRKGLMLGVDLRFTKLEGIETIVMPTFNLGYEAF